MLVDECRQRSEAVVALLQSAGCHIVANPAPGENLLEQVERHRPDVVIIDVDLPSRDTLESLRSVQATEPRPMVMFSQDDNGATIRKAVEAGVSAYVAEGIQSKRVRPILDAAIATFDQYQLLQKQLDVTRGELEKQKKLDRAKRILMTQRGISEQDAYAFIRSSAMQQKVKIERIAEKIIDAADLLGGFN